MRTSGFQQRKNFERKLTRWQGPSLGWTNFLWAVPLAMCVAARPSLAHHFVGATRCASCHAFEYQVWQRSAHANSFAALQGAQAQNKNCVACHSIPEADGPQAVGVQCESCHGAGSVYQADYVMRDHDLSRAVGLLDTPPQSCQTCHTPGVPSLVPFDYKSFWARIDHSRQARLVWEKAQQLVGPVVSDGSGVSVFR